MQQPLRQAVREAPIWLVSILVHALLLAVLACFYIEERQKPKRVQVLSDLHEEREPEEFLDVLENLNDAIETDAALSSMSSPAMTAAGVADLQDLESQFRQSFSALTPTAAIFSDKMSRPLAHNSTKLELGDMIDGLAGASFEAGGSDSGAVDQITAEILRQLTKSKVLVAWVMDASGSLEMRREAVLDRFDKVYKELGHVGVVDNDILLTGIVAYGKDAVFMTPKPTSDAGEIRRAVRGIKSDPNGIENVFSAVRETCIKWRKYQTHGRRKLMVVVLTDETGDDLNILDETCRLVKRNDVPVYVLGPLAPFGRKEVSLRWVDEPTGESFRIPVDRGPETIQPEHLSLPYWYNGPQYNVFSSGFGPYGLTRLARESGGIYFVFDDGAIPGPQFKLYDLMTYVPDYNSYSEYAQTMQKNPLRAAVVRAAKQSQGAGGQPPMRFSTENFKESMTRAQRTVAATSLFVERALIDLRAVEKHRPQETSARWRAHYDLMMGRLLAHKVRCNEYNWTLAQMKLDPKPVTKEDKNAWGLEGDSTISFGQQEGKSSRRPDKDTEQAKQDAEKATEYLQRVAAEHDGTPWGLMAQRELEAPLGFKWVQVYIAPPADRARTPRDREAAERAARRAEAAKRVPNL